MDLHGKTAVITGAASGFGREFARACAQAGMDLMLADVDEAGLVETAAASAALGVGVRHQRCDVSRPDQVEDLARIAFDGPRPVGLVFNNAGVASGGPVWTSTPDDWQWVLGVNLMGVVHGIQSFVPRLIAAGRPAHVVNTASIAGLISPAGLGVYAASKHAVVALSECLFHELRAAEAPVGVSVLCPGFVATGIARSHRNRPADLANANPHGRAARDRVEQITAAATVTAAQVADRTLAGVRENRFYILTHPETGPAVRQRMADILETDSHGPRAVRLG